VALRERVTEAARALLGVSPYARAPQYGQDIDAPLVERLRTYLGGQLQPLPNTRTRLYLADLESATLLADRGDLSLCSQICSAMRRDGMLNGLLATRTAGLVALPKRWRGRADIVGALKAENGTRSLFDEMFPPSELALLAADGIAPGIGVAEMCVVEGRPHPVMVRLDPEFLRFNWQEQRWYYLSVAGPIAIDPGDGRWILHTPGGRLTPWRYSVWSALARAFITKEHAMLSRANYAAKLANPARVAKTPQGAAEEHRFGFIGNLIAWGLNTVIELPAGWEVDLLESNGRGWEVFGKEIETSDLEIMIALAGQVVTVTGGTGFANADIHQTIRSDLIKQTGDALAQTINSQGIPPWEFKLFGAGAFAETARFSWDTDPPADRKDEAAALQSLAQAIPAITQAYAAEGLAVDAVELANRYGIPLKVQGQMPETPDGAPEQQEPQAPRAAESPAGVEPGPARGAPEQLEESEKTP
jgi:hypothetical protein